MCKSIIGFDANALYMWCFTQNMPVGHLINRKQPSFIPERNDKYMNMFYWMDFLNKKYGLNILHKMNNSKEKKIGPYYVDGYDPITNIIYEYNGCFFHAHDCITNDPDKDKKKI